jgi:hypothetical protein
MKIEYISIPLVLAILIQFFKSLFKLIQKDIIFYIFIYLIIALSTINLLTPIYIYTQLIEIYQLLAIFISLYIIIKLIIFIKLKIEFAKTFLIGSGMIVLK